jgi:hypothetical protein
MVLFCFLSIEPVRSDSISYEYTKIRLYRIAKIIQLFKIAIFNGIAQNNSIIPSNKFKAL